MPPKKPEPKKPEKKSKTEFELLAERVDFIEEKTGFRKE